MSFSRDIMIKDCPMHKKIFYVLDWLLTFLYSSEIMSTFVAVCVICRMYTYAAGALENLVIRSQELQSHYVL